MLHGRDGEVETIELAPGEDVDGFRHALEEPLSSAGEFDCESSTQPPAVRPRASDPWVEPERSRLHGGAGLGPSESPSAVAVALKRRAVWPSERPPLTLNVATGTVGGSAP